MNRDNKFLKKGENKSSMDSFVVAKEVSLTISNPLFERKGAEEGDENKEMNSDLRITVKTNKNLTDSSMTTAEKDKDFVTEKEAHRRKVSSYFRKEFDR